MVHIEDGVIYTASYDAFSDGLELWQVCYGDATKAVKAPKDLLGKCYEGTYNAYVEKSGKVERSFEDKLSIEINMVDHDTNVMEIVLSTSQGDSHMGAIIFPYGSGYRFFMESVFDNNGETFWGYYVGTISKDHKRMTIIGSADNGMSTSMIFKNDLRLFA